MYRWMFYVAMAIGGVVLLYWASALLNATDPGLAGWPTPDPSLHPWVLQVYRLLRGYEGLLYLLLALGLTPRILGLRSLQPQFQSYRPNNGALWRASVWHLVVSGWVGYLVYLMPESPLTMDGNRLPRLIELGRSMPTFASMPGVSSLWMIGQPVAVLLLYLITWRNPRRFHLMAATPFLVGGLTLPTLAPAPWPWKEQAVLFSFLAPWTILALSFLGGWLRDRSKSPHPVAFVFLVGFSLPVVGLTYWLVQNWPTIGCRLAQTSLILRGMCIPPHELPRALDDWSFAMGFVAIILFFVSIGVAVRSSEPGATLIPKWIRRFALPDLNYHLPRRSYPRIEIEPPQTGWSVLDVPILIVMRLIQQLANTILSTVQIFDNAVTFVLDGLLHLAYALISLAYHLLLYLVVHTVYTVIQLPRLLLRSLGEILDSVDLLLRELFLPLVGSCLAAFGLTLFVNTGVSYFLQGHPQLLSWNLFGAYTALFGILVTLSAVAWKPFSYVLAWYMLNLIEWLSYPLVISVAFLWTAIWLGPHFGIRHFRPGPVTWTLTAVLALVLILGVVLGRRSSQAVQSESIPAE